MLLIEVSPYINGFTIPAVPKIVDDLILIKTSNRHIYIKVVVFIYLIKALKYPFNFLK